MDFTQFRALYRIWEAAITAGTVYATVDKADGTGSLNSFIDVSGVPVPLSWQVVSDARGVVYGSVTATINNITVTADPSSVV